jgi:integrase
MVEFDRRPEEGRYGVSTTVRLRWAAPIARDAFQLSLGPHAAEQGLAVSAGPATVEEIIAVMRAAGEAPDGIRLRGVIIVLWRAGLRISEALALSETDLDRERGAVLVRAGKGGRRREVGMDRWAWDHLDPWLELRASLPVGALFCVLRGPTRGRPCAPTGIRGQLRRAAQAAGVRRRFAPHQLRHSHAVEMSREGIPPLVI